LPSCQPPPKVNRQEDGPRCSFQPLSSDFQRCCARFYFFRSCGQMTAAVRRRQTSRPKPPGRALVSRRLRNRDCRTLRVGKRKVFDNGAPGRASPDPAADAPRLTSTALICCKAFMRKYSFSTLRPILSTVSGIGRNWCAPGWHEACGLTALWLEATSRVPRSEKQEPGANAILPSHACGDQR
jgi:hypothetical protein